MKSVKPKTTLERLTILTRDASNCKTRSYLHDDQPANDKFILTHGCFIKERDTIKRIYFKINTDAN